MKVVWLCNVNLTPFARQLGIGSDKFVDQHPVTWITTLYKNFAKYKNIELSIITTSQFVNKIERIVKDNVSFIIIPKNRYPFPSKQELSAKYSTFLVFIIRTLLVIPKSIFKVIKIIDVATFYLSFVLRVVKIIKQVNPDIIHSHGTEFVYSIPLNYLKYPSIVQVQGLMANVVMVNKSFLPRLQKKIEDCVFKKQKNFIINADFIKDIITTHNTTAKFWKIYYMLDIEIFRSIPSFDYDADLVFAAAIDKSKGIEDLLLACKQIKTKYPNFTLKIIGYNSSHYVLYLKSLIQEYNLVNNIRFLGYIPDRREMLIEVKKSKISILPTYHDTTPGTISEAMFLGVAMIAYNIGGIPEMIVHGESGILVEKGNINQLSESIIYLLENETKRNYMIDNAKARADLLYNRKVADQMINAYSLVILNSKSKMEN